MSDCEGVPDPTPPRRNSAAGDTQSRGKQGRGKEKQPRTGGPRARPPEWRGLIEACLGNEDCAWKRLVEHCRPVCLRQGRHVVLVSRAAGIGRLENGVVNRAEATRRAIATTHRSEGMS